MAKNRPEPDLDRELSDLPPELRWREWRRRIEAVIFASASPVPVAYGHRDVWVRGYVDWVVIGCGGDVIARHPRCWDREDMVFDPVHYLPLLEQKTGALDQAADSAPWRSLIAMIKS